MRVKHLIGLGAVASLVLLVGCDTTTDKTSLLESENVELRDQLGVQDRALEAAHAADAILLGAVGGPKWEILPFEIQPESWPHRHGALLWGLDSADPVIPATFPKTGMTIQIPHAFSGAYDDHLITCSHGGGLFPRTGGSGGHSKRGIARCLLDDSTRNQASLSIQAQTVGKGS